MRGLAAISLMFLAASSAAAASATVEAKPATAEVLRGFGLFGMWAVDCTRDAAPDNPHVSDLMVRPGLVLERHDLGPDSAKNIYRIIAAERLSATRLSLRVIFQPGGEREERQHLELVVRDGTRRTMFNEPEGGPVLVKDGVAVGFGVQTPLLRKCE